MLCCQCNQNEATVHLTEVVGDKMKKVDLCEACAKAKGVSDPAGFALADLLLGLGASQQVEQSAGAEGGQLACANCGFTQADFKKTGRLGCSECYNSFADGLEGVLKTMHKGTRHVGKVPKALRQVRDVSDQLKTLQKKLDKSITTEDFEQAAVLRDEIKKLQKRLTEVAAPER
ncbi:MAG: excinuclease ABC subunit B [Pedosphaera sp.]|nr:excinuclease ABC subunit B [Pedosphaera sp.]MSS99790.1 excinuclease ABC subunit B [Pedosphaera sp.]